MAAKLEIVGALAEPKRGQTREGKSILNLSVGHTPRRFNKDTNQWEDVGDTLWVRAAFWEDEADLIGAQVQKGMRVRLEGEPVLSVREHEGRTYTNLELKRASIAFLPRRDAQPGAGQAQSGFVGGSSGQGGFGAQEPSWSEETPF